MASPQTPSSLDKIPAELRINIFGLALYHEDALLIVHHDGRTRDECRGDNEPKADIALLVALVNDPKLHEAFEAFYDVNSFLATKNMLVPDITQSPLAWITHLQLVNLVNYRQFLSPQRLERTLEICAQMPKLKNLTIAWSKLPAHELVCVGVGHFRLRYKDKLSVDFKQYALVQCWQNVRLATPKSFADLVAALEQKLAGKHPSDDYDYKGDCIDTTITFIYGLRFTDWLTLLDEQIKLDSTALKTYQKCEGKLTAESLLHVIFYDPRKPNVDIEAHNKLIAYGKTGSRLRDVDDGEQDSDLVEAFSEFLQSGVRDKSPQMGDARY
ncbi:hypothetical protein LTR17_002650 [Elasticomyces elasticus]|nr:hypothetical protein LTR17_002650 [Elasticomyces elasticus]